MTEISIETVKYIDGKFRSQKNFMLIILVVFITAFLTIGGAGIKTLASVKTKQDIMWVEYVPGDLLWEIVFSYDMQNQWLLSLEKGDKEGALKILEEFREYRRAAYENKLDKRTRSGNPKIRLELGDN